MVELRLLVIFVICAAMIPIVGFFAVKFSHGGERSPVIVIPLTRELEYIVRTSVYPIAEKFPDALVIALDNGADEETLRIFRTLMERSCRYEVIRSEECSDSICRLLKNRST